MKNLFIEAIHQKNIVLITFNSKEKGVLKRTCIPFDYGPSRRSNDKRDKYHFYDLNSPDGSHTLSIWPEQLINIEVTANKFEPGDYINWPTNWFVKRDWGRYS